MDVKTEKPKTAISLSKLKTFDSFNVPAFRIFFGSLAGNWLAANMLNIVNTLLLYRLTDSVFLVGVMTLAYYTPVLIFSLVGGAIADRIQKKYILFVSRLGSTGSALIIAVALTMGYMGPGHQGSWWLLVVSAFLNGLFTGFVSPATMAIVPELVGKERVMNAISLTSLGQTIFRFIGPTLAGVLVDSYGFFIVFYIISGLNGIAAIVTSFLPRSSNTVTAGRSTLGDISEGLKYIRRETIFLLLVLFAVCHMIGGIPYLQLMPVFTESILKVSATMLGLLNGMLGVGSLITSLVFASLPGKKRGVIMLLSGIIMGLSVIGFAYSRSWYLSMGMVFITGVAMSMHWTLTSTLVQSYAHPAYRARMQSLVSMAMGFSGFGVFVAGVLSEAIGLQLAVASMGILLFVATIVIWSIPTRLRKLE